MDQANWNAEQKDLIWREIVRQKIWNQISALEKCGKEVPASLVEYVDSIEPGDSTNREAVAAKVYFHSLFGYSFSRHSRDVRNAALNYGYALICSTAARTISMHGFHVALGIHHHSRNNRMNLACDIMEPFRPFIDVVVSKQGKRYLDNDLKTELIKALHEECVVDGRKMSIEDAIEFYGTAMLKALNESKTVLPEVRFE